jgi:hypothetical protein
VGAPADRARGRGSPGGRIDFRERVAAAVSPVREPKLAGSLLALSPDRGTCIPEPLAPILVVEDDPSHPRIHRRLLADDGLEVIRARDCGKALAVMESGGFPSVWSPTSASPRARAASTRHPGRRALADVKLLIVSGQVPPEPWRLSRAGDLLHQALMPTAPWLSMIRSSDW